MNHSSFSFTKTLFTGRGVGVLPLLLLFTALLALATLPAQAAAQTIDLKASSDTGISDTDNITNDNSPTFTLSGFSATDQTTVTAEATNTNGRSVRDATATRTGDGDVTLSLPSKIISRNGIVWLITATDGTDTASMKITLDYYATIYDDGYLHHFNDLIINPIMGDDSINGDDDDRNITVTGTGAQNLVAETLTFINNVKGYIIPGLTPGVPIEYSTDFGSAVVLDGDRIIVGSYIYDSSRGAIYILEDKNNDGDYADAGENIRISDDTPGISLDDFDRFGAAIAVDGDRIFVAATGDDDGGSSRGAIYILEDKNNDGSYDGTGENIKLSSNTPGISLDNLDLMGTDIAVDGDRIIVGTPGDDDGGTNRGAIYILEDKNNDGRYDGTGENIKLSSNTPGISLDDHDHFGFAVAVDGDRIIVGTPGDDDGGTNRGAIYILEDKNNDGSYDGTGENIKLSSNTPGITLENGYEFGFSIAVDGDRIIVGVIEGGTDGQGAVYILQDADNDGAYDKEGEVTIIDTASIGVPSTAPPLHGGQEFGYAVSVQGDTLAIGAADWNITRTGGVFLFDMPAPVPQILNKEDLAGVPVGESDFGTAIARMGNRLFISSVERNDTNGIIYVLEDKNNDGDYHDTDELEHYLGGPEVLELVGGLTSLTVRMEFGAAMVADGNRLIVGAPESDNGKGAVYILEDKNGDGDYQRVVDTKVRADEGEVIRIHDGTPGIDLEESGIYLSQDGDNFGQSVVASGNRLYVGAPGDGTGGQNSGAVYILEDKNNDGSYDGDGENIKISDDTPGISLNNSATFGYSIAVDGSRLIVGAPNQVWGFSISQQRVYILEDKNNDGRYDGAGENIVIENSRTSRTTPSVSEQFGSSLAVDGDRIIVGTSNNHYRGIRTGVYILEDKNNDGDYTDTGENVRIDHTTHGVDIAASSKFGNAVLVDGDHIYVGAKGAQSIYLFDRHDPKPIRAHEVEKEVTLEEPFVDPLKITENSPGITLNARGSFGTAFAVDGDRLIVGAPTDNTGGEDRGAVYILEDKNNDGDWEDTGENTKISSDTTGITLDNSDKFGSAVAVDGDRLIVSAPGDDDGGGNRGAVYILEDKNDDGDYADTGENIKLSHSTRGITLNNSDGFGTSIAVDGDRLIVGVPVDETGGVGRGAVYILENKDNTDYEYDGTGENIKLSHSTDGITLDNNDNFGSAVAVDGDRIIVGADRDDDGGDDHGAVYILEDKNNDGDYADAGENIKINSDTIGITLEKDDGFGSSVAVDGNRLIIGASEELGPVESDEDTGGFFYILEDLDGDGNYNEEGETVRIDHTTPGMVLEGYTVAVDGNNNVVQEQSHGPDAFGRAVAVDGDRIYVTAPGDDDGGFDKGAVYIFDSTHLYRRPFSVSLTPEEMQELGPGTLTARVDFTDIAGNWARPVDRHFTYAPDEPNRPKTEPEGSDITTSLGDFNTSVNLFWESHDDADVTHYRVYRTSVSGGEDINEADPFAVIPVSNQHAADQLLTFTDTNIAPTEYYRYRVEAINDAWTPSGACSETDAAINSRRHGETRKEICLRVLHKYDTVGLRIPGSSFTVNAVTHNGDVVKTHSVLTWNDIFGPCPNNYLIIGSKDENFSPANSEYESYACGILPAKNNMVVRYTAPWMRMVCDSNNNGIVDRNDRIIGTAQRGGNYTPPAEPIILVRPRNFQRAMGEVRHYGDRETAIALRFNRPIDPNALPSAGDFTLETLESEIPGGVTVTRVARGNPLHDELLLYPSKNIPYLADVNLIYTPGATPLRSTAPHAEVKAFETGKLGFRVGTLGFRLLERRGVVNEGAGFYEGAVEMRFGTVFASAPAVRPVKDFPFGFISTDETLRSVDKATPEKDFSTVEMEQLVIPAGQSRVSFSVPIIEDTIAEDDEGFRVRLMRRLNTEAIKMIAGIELVGVDDSVIISAVTEVDLQDNDTSVISLEDADPTTGIASYTVTEGETVDIPIVLTNPIDESPPVNIKSSTPPGTAGSDDWSWESGVESNGRVNIPATTTRNAITRHVITFAATADDVADDGETVKMELQLDAALFGLSDLRNRVTVDSIKKKVVITINDADSEDGPGGNTGPGDDDGTPPGDDGVPPSDEGTPPADPDGDDTRATATTTMQVENQVLDRENDDIRDYYTFTITERKKLGYGVRYHYKNNPSDWRLRKDSEKYCVEKADHDYADLLATLESSDGTQVAVSGAPGNARNDPCRDQGFSREWLSATLEPGTYYIKVEAQADGKTSYYTKFSLSTP